MLCVYIYNYIFAHNMHVRKKKHILIYRALLFFFVQKETYKKSDAHRSPYARERIPEIPCLGLSFRFCFFADTVKNLNLRK